mmetsp:Transcript_96719/g.273234  ORF Transcript_96719/g.273234 Transcript_96719/m.273234 type:complete len:447 (-) Transcript_96719:90-1430(-)
MGGMAKRPVMEGTLHLRSGQIPFIDCQEGAFGSKPCRSASLLRASVFDLACEALHRILTVLWRPPSQAAKLCLFFSRLGLYVICLLPFLIPVAAYLACPWRHLFSAKYKDGGGLRHTCDIYPPATCGEARAKGMQPMRGAPVVVIISGGAWMVGHKAYLFMLCRALSRAGVLCIAVDYRSWPQVSVDGMVEDCDAAVEWALRNCAAYGGDPKRLTLIGLSSGAHVGALLLASRAADEIRNEADKCGTGLGRSWTCSDVCGFVGLSGVYQLDEGFMSHLHGKGIDYTLQRLIFGSKEATRECRSPTALVRSRPELAARMPPVLLVHGTCDKISPYEQSQAFCRALTEAGARDARAILRQGEGHNDPVIHCPLMSDHGTVRAILLSLWRWGATDTAMGSAAANEDGRGYCNRWESAAETSCKGDFNALPSWPRLPLVVIDALRGLTPF